MTARSEEVVQVERPERHVTVVSNERSVVVEGRDLAVVSRSDERHVAVSQSEVRVVAVGQQGLPGPPGPQGVAGAPGSGAAPVISVQNGDSVSLRKGCPVVLVSAGVVGRANAVNAADVVGMVSDDFISVGSFGLVQLSGLLSATQGDWEDATGVVGQLQAGAKYFLSTAAGEITLVPDTNEHVLLLGRAVSGLMFSIDIEPVILKG